MGQVLDVTGEVDLKVTLGKIQPFRYRGYVYDVETGLYYLRSRYYVPGIGRFTTFDKLINNKQEPLENNNYLYCCNDPINYFDDSGYDYRPIGVGSMKC